MGASLLKRSRWLIPVQLGVGFIGGGAYMVAQGLAAKKTVREALLAEQILTAEEADPPRTLVQDVRTAEAQAEIIRLHSLRETGGRTYSELPRGDPLRDYYLNGVTLRSALGLAVMGLRVSDLVVGMGAFMAAVGGAMIVIAPSLKTTDED
jgi:hypothetical protein